MNILLVEDNDRFGRLLCDHLIKAAYVADWIKTIGEFHDVAAVMSHDLYIIDLGMPDGDGIELIKDIRRARKPVPILIASARGCTDDFVKGLDAGADDYIAKPFNVEVLLSRVRALMRRPPTIEPKQMQAGRLVLESATGEVFFNGSRIELRPSERRLLALLIKRLGRVVPKDAIEASIRGMDNQTTGNATEKLISRLRNSISAVDMGVSLKTVRGTGYLLEETMALT